MRSQHLNAPLNPPSQIGDPRKSGHRPPTLEEITGIEIVSQTADVEDGEIQQYKTTVHVAFELQRQSPDLDQFPPLKLLFHAKN